VNLAKFSWGKRRAGGTGEEPWAFTDHVRALASGKPLDPKRLDELLHSLRSALRNELKKRGLWEAPPSYLGIFGWTAWEASAGTRENALEELLAECYAYIFVARLRGLQAQLKLKPNIDGLVFLNIRHFLHERQKEHDPLGAQVFEVAQSAVRAAVEEKELRVVGGDEKVRNDTVLSFGPGMEDARANRERFPSVVARWNDELLPDLVTLRGRRQEEVVQRLRARLSDLRREGLEVFRFKDLVDPLKADVRARWAAILDRSQGEAAPQMEEGSGEISRVVQPDTGLEERQVFRKLVDCVLTAIRREPNEKTRGYLATLWQFLRMRASDGEEEGPASRLGRTMMAEMESADEDQPSHRQLAERLSIPRDRISALYRTLGTMLQECRAAISGKAAVMSLKGSSTLRTRKGRPDGH
jgi:hypothetical protein